MKSLAVHVARVESQSPVWVGRGIISALPQLANTKQFSKIVVVGDSGASATVTSLLSALSLAEDKVLTMQGGETCKSIQRLQEVWSFFSEQRLERRSLVISVGGGAISDLIGFAAATYMRGVAFIPIPTTLLAQVDASIGGKSGINFGGVKNVLGSIRQPAGILIDIDTLQTLSDRERRSGFAEIVKHGLISDASYFTSVTAQDCLRWTPDELSEIVYRSCEIKRDVVEADESEQGLRKNLNFGHTLGHAIEALALVEGASVTHGEAVSIGMHAAAHISHRQGLISANDLHTITDGLVRVGLPITLPQQMSEAKLLELIQFDKKNVAGKTRWTLLQRIGHAVFDQEVSDSNMAEAIRAVQPKS